MLIARKCVQPDLRYKLYFALYTQTKLIPNVFTFFKALKRSLDEANNEIVDQNLRPSKRQKNNDDKAKKIAQVIYEYMKYSHRYSMYLKWVYFL